MTLQSVEAIFFWRFSVSAFRPVYGRLGAQGGYTKDFLQSPQTQQQIIDAVLKRPAGGSVPVEYVWPGGAEPDGVWRESAADTRGQLAWPTNHPPAPWKVGDPTTSDVTTITGDPTRTNAPQADQVFSGIETSNVRPWLLAIKLVGEPNRLHLRVYLENPPAGQEDRGTSVLPPQVRQAINTLPPNQGGGGLVVGHSHQSRSPALLAEIQSALETSPNVLLVGPPGTGKTVVLEDLRALFEAQVMFDPDIWGDAWSFQQGSPARKSTALVFHPSYSYENFVAGLMPKGGTAGFELAPQPGALISLAHWASSPGREALLIIDEFNRGAAAAIFGDMLALLDGDKRSGGTKPGITIARPFVPQPMAVSAEHSQVGGITAVPPQIGLPSSLKIVAAMNSTDRSVAPLDAALRRRFAIIHVGPDYAALARHLGVPVPTFNAAFAPADPVIVGDVRELAIRLLESLNRRIGAALGRDFLLGQALLWDVQGADVPQLLTSLSQQFDRKVSSTLRLTFVDQDDVLAAVLSIGQEGSALGRWIAPPTGLEGVAVPRLELASVASLPSWQEQLAALRSMLHN